MTVTSSLSLPLLSSLSRFDEPPPLLSRSCFVTVLLLSLISCLESELLFSDAAIVNGPAVSFSAEFLDVLNMFYYWLMPSFLLAFSALYIIDV